MRNITIRRLEWDEGEKERLVWKIPEKNITWNSTLVVRENQAATLLSGRKFLSKRLQMHDLFTHAGEYIISPSTIPLLVKEFPEVVARTHFPCFLVFCSTKEHSYSAKIYAGDAYGQAYVHTEALAHSRLKITKAEKFMRNVVANKKKISNDTALKYLDKTLRDELFRQRSPYGWPPKQNIPLAEIWETIGIELLGLEFERYKESAGGVSA